MEILSIVGKILTLIGSLGLFLFGMKLMSEALQKVAGRKMRNILRTMTSNRIKGIFTGFLVTSTIQSSSATTVMVVSFVNAGLLSLIGAIGVIMGANIGTTVTAWIISLLGFKVSMSLFSLPLIGLSFPLFFSKHSQRKAWGEFLIGFAILFIGLEFLKKNIPALDESSPILQYLSSYTNLGFISVLLFLGLGTILTIIIQSSSATMALTLVMCYNNWINFEMAAAMVLGENIGTTVTANLAAIVANVSAKRAARAHFIFNIIGVIWILAIFHPFLRGIDWFINEKHGFSILNKNLSKEEFEQLKGILPIGLSVFHTSFNILNTLLLYGFGSYIAKIVVKMVPDKVDEDEEFRLKYINMGLVSISELSIVEAKKEIGIFGERLVKMYSFMQQMMVEEGGKKYKKLFKKIGNYEEITDRMEEEIATYLTKISESRISRKGTKSIRSMLKIIDDMESVADVCYQIAKNIDNKREMKLSFTEEMEANLLKMVEIVRKSLDIMNKNLSMPYNDVDIKEAYDVETKINRLRDKLRNEQVELIESKKCSYRAVGIYGTLISLLERTADYIINVTEAIVEA